MGLRPGVYWLVFNTTLKTQGVIRFCWAGLETRRFIIYLGLSINNRSLYHSAPRIDKLASLQGGSPNTTHLSFLLLAALRFQP